MPMAEEKEERWCMKVIDGERRRKELSEGERRRLMLFGVVRQYAV